MRFVVSSLTPSLHSIQPEMARAPLVYAVDDESIMVDFVELALSSQGFRVIRFSDPAPALAAVTSATELPSLLVTDFAMHTMSGLDFAREMRGRVPHLRVLLVSGTVDETLIAEVPGLFDRFLRKPYRMADLIAAAHELVPTARPR